MNHITVHAEVAILNTCLKLATHKLLFVVVFLVNVLCPRVAKFGSNLFTNFFEVKH